jgi:hypothetical protein
MLGVLATAGKGWASATGWKKKGRYSERGGRPPPARRWLAPGGVILPDAAALRVLGVDDREHLAGAKAFWAGEPYGLDLSPALGAVVRQPRLDTLARKSQMVTDAVTLLQLDAYTMGAQVGAGGAAGGGGGGGRGSGAGGRAGQIP